MNQPDLFSYCRISTRELLLGKAREGLLFYGITQVATITGKTPFEVRYAIIATYHLDALRLGDEYRIPYTAILDYLDYLENKTGEYIELDGSKDCDPGRIALYRYLAMLPHRHAPEGCMPYDSMPGKTESCPVDWYSLPQLPLPDSAPAYVWASILGVTADVVEKGVGISGLIGWPDMFDWLVECEVVNLPIPMELVSNRKEEKMPPGLFD